MFSPIYRQPKQQRITSFPPVILFDSPEFGVGFPRLSNDHCGLANLLPAQVMEPLAVREKVSVVLALKLQS